MSAVKKKRRYLLRLVWERIALKEKKKQKMHLIRSVKIVEAFTALNAKKGLLRIGIHVNAKKKVPQGFEPRQTDDL